MRLSIFILGFMALPIFVSAHGMMDFNSSSAAPEMMRYIEDKALASNELHEEMEDLMAKMMQGKLTETEANRMVEIMNQYPGPMGMMMTRLGMNQNMRGGNLPQNMMNMMNWGFGFSVWISVWFWLVFLCVIIWLVVGVLAAIWLWKQIQNKQ